MNENELDKINRPEVTAYIDGSEWTCTGKIDSPNQPREALINLNRHRGDPWIDEEIYEKCSWYFKRIVFEEDLAQIKNLIYSNIYNNLLYIYKSKGTEKSFRNLIRCYGVGDELISLNLYANNVTYEFQDNYEPYNILNPRRHSKEGDNIDLDSTISMETSIICILAITPLLILEIKKEDTASGMPLPLT